MKVALITIFDNINLGTIFQAYALAEKITNLGHKVELINYIRPHETTFGQVIDKFSQSGNLLKRMFNSFVYLTVVPYAKRRLKLPISKKFELSKVCTTIEELKRANIIADVFMTGSDQVWNCSYNHGVDECYFLGFTNKKKCAYAASVGTDVFPEEYLSKVKNLLSSYDKITVRENQTCKYLKKIGFKDVECVLDPTLLISKDEWLEKFNLKDKAPLMKEKYLLVYSVESTINDFIFQQAKMIADERGLKIVALTSGGPLLLRKYRTICDKIYSFADTRKFLSLLRDASFVVASSFHGTAFSINFNKEFITITPPRFNIRMRSIIEQFNLNSRIVTDKLISTYSLDPLDYTAINALLLRYREKSISLLDEMLKK